MCGSVLSLGGTDDDQLLDCGRAELSVAGPAGVGRPGRGDRAPTSPGAPVDSVHGRERVFMALSLIAVDGYFVVVLAAWWRLRRSAYLLPHRRRGPSSFVFHPGHGLVARIMAIITVPVVLILRGRRLLTGRVVVPNGQPAQTRLLLGAQPRTRRPPAGRVRGWGRAPGEGAGPPRRSRFRPGPVRPPRRRPRRRRGRYPRRCPRRYPSRGARRGRCGGCPGGYRGGCRGVR